MGPGFVGDDGGFEGVPLGVEGIDGRDVGVVGTAVVDDGGCCAGVVVGTSEPALFRLEDDAE